MELVEQDCTNTFKSRIIEDHAAEDALRDHLDAGLRADFGLEPHAQADRLADRLPQGLGHSCRRRPRRQTPGLQHDDLAALEPRLIQERQRNPRGLTRPRRCHKHGAVLPG